MNISSISNQTTAQYQPSLEGPFKQRFQDFRALQSALQSGNLSDAQSAFAAFQNDIQNGSKDPGTLGNGTQQAQTAKDLQALGDALKSGDVAAAQKAFATVKQDMQAMRGQHHHGHHKAASDGDAKTVTATTAATTASTNSTSTILNALA
jgi:hypothetical protein